MENSDTELPDLDFLADDIDKSSPEIVVTKDELRKQRISYYEKKELEETLPANSSQDTHLSTYRSYLGIINNVIEVSDSEEEEDQIKDDLPRNDDENLTQILILMKSTIDEEKCTKFNINRRNILDGAERAINRKSFDPRNKIDVIFTDFGNPEGAIDQGGPKRELLRLILQEFQSSMVFEGREYNKNLSNNSSAFEKNLYRNAGVFIALSIVHGGPAPRFFSKALFNSVAYGIPHAASNIQVEDIADHALQTEVLKIKDANTLDELQLVIENKSSLLTAAGCHRPVVDLYQKQKITHDLAVFLVLGRTATCLQQFEKGLETLGLLTKIREYPNLMKDLFLVEKIQTINAELVGKLFHPYFKSSPGSNQRMREEKILGFWRDALIDIEGMKCLYMSDNSPRGDGDNFCISE